MHHIEITIEIKLEKFLFKTQQQILEEYTKLLSHLMFNAVTL